MVSTDPDGLVQAWFDDWLPQADMRTILEWPHPQNNFGIPPYYPGTPLPAPNYSRPPAPKLNTWYRPTGAGRWAFGFFLCDYTRLQQILGQIGTNNAGQALTLDTFPISGHTRSWANCFLLPPHPVSASVSDPAGLYILPIVDERWYWQFETGFQLPTDNTAPTAKTWAAEFAALATAIGINLTVDTIPAQYLYPNLSFINGTTWHNAGILLDALAWSVGQRIIPAYNPYGPNTGYPGGVWRSANWGSSKTIRTTNLSGTADLGALQAGSLAAFPNQAAIVPGGILVVFRAYKNGIVIGDYKTARYQSPVTAAAAGQLGGTTADYTVTILSTALADISTSGDSTNPDNKATLDALALQIAQDYYSSLWIQDSAVVGVSQWQESGYDDYVEFRAGRPDGAGAMPSTRIHSQPYNCVMERMLHYDTTTWEYGDKIYGTLDGNLSANGTQTITLTGTDGAKPSGTTHLLVTSVVGNTGSTGDKIEAFRFADVWGVNGVASGGSGTGTADLITGTCAAVVVSGSSATFTIDAAFGGGTVTASVNLGICLTGISYQIGKFKDGTYKVINPTRRFVGKFAAANVYGGNSGTLTIYSGTLGAETSTGVSVTAYVRNGYALSFNPLQVCQVAPDGTYEIVPGCAYALGNTTVVYCTGAAVAVTVAGVTAVLTQGLIQTSKRDYLVVPMNVDSSNALNYPAYVADPDLSFWGTVTVGNIAQFATGTVSSIIDGTTVNVWNAQKNAAVLGTKVFVQWCTEGGPTSTSPFWVITSGS